MAITLTQLRKGASIQNLTDMQLAYLSGTNEQKAAFRAYITGGLPDQFGTSVAITGATTLTAALHDGVQLDCSSVPDLTINAGLGAKFSAVIMGDFTFTGTATVVDKRVGAGAAFIAALVPTAVVNTYWLIGSTA